MTKPLYLADTYLFEYAASIATMGHDDIGHYVMLDQTIFYPQGGGQPSDQGFIRGNDFELQVNSVRTIDHEIRHYLTAKASMSLSGSQVSLFLDKNRRMINAQYHTAAHLISNVAETLYPSLKAVKGHAFPNEAYLEFQGNTLPDHQLLQSAIDEAVGSNYPIKVFTDGSLRMIQIGDYHPIPCGGTHLATTTEIGKINLSKIKVKNDAARISYEIT